MAILEIRDNNSCALLEEKDISFLWKLDKELSYAVPGAQYTKAYKGYTDRKGNFQRWDGIQRLLKEDLSFPAGLRYRVIDFYAQQGRALNVRNCRPSPSIESALDITPKLISLGKTPYPYQLDIVEKVKQQDCGIIRLCTGGGKSLLSALMTANFGKKTIIYVIGRDLLYQLHKFFVSIFDQPIGIVGDNNCEIHDINIVSVWTAGKALGLKQSNILSEAAEEEETSLDSSHHQKIKDMLKSTKVHIFDECHLAACETIQEISRNINPEYIYGMSASPWRDDNADLLIECVLGKKFIDISASYLIERGYLVPALIKFLKVPALYKTKKAYKTVYKECLTDNPARNDMVVRSALQFIEQKHQTLVLYSGIAHGEHLYRKLLGNTSVAFLSGKDSSEVRMAVKAQLENREINCIVASKIFDIGVDLPSLSGLVLAGGGKSSVRALQRIGRVIRGFPGKKFAAVADFDDQAPYLRQHANERRKIYSTEEKFKIYG